ncbi:MAG: hypothetical protein QOF78_2434 [Phycisphaerales bacterium]|jgi:hypothetical protein|nr:hypothetical protein [Phycisphaerales bacterium]
MTMLKLAAAALVCSMLMMGCAPRMAADAKSTARQREQLYKYEGRDVTLVGRTRMIDTERYRGAALVLDDATEVRVPEVKSWPTFNTGDRITIRGQLRRYTLTGTRGADPGEWFTLEAVRWQKGDLAPKAR